MSYRRFLLGCFLLSILIFLMMYYSLDHNKHDPDFQYILGHFEEFNNTKVTLSGEIKNVDRTNNTLLIQVDQPPKSIIIVSTTDNLNTTKEGDIVEVYGVLTSITHLTPEKIIFSERWMYDLIFVRSLPAIPFVLYLFFRTWRFNRNTRRFERRKKNA